MTCTFDLDCYLVNVLLLFFQLSLPHTWIFAGPYGSTTSRTTLTCASYIATYSTDRDSLMTTSSTGTCWNLWVESFWPLIIMASPICWNQVVDQTYFGCNTYTVCPKHPTPPPPQHPVPQMKTCHGSPRISDLSRTFYCCKDILNSRPGGVSYVIICRVPTDQGNQGIQGKFWRLFPVREIREKQGFFSQNQGKKFQIRELFFQTIFKPFKPINLRKMFFRNVKPQELSGNCNICID